jgi:hypothetical protein
LVARLERNRESFGSELQRKSNPTQDSSVAGEKKIGNTDGIRRHASGGEPKKQTLANRNRTRRRPSGVHALAETKPGRAESNGRRPKPCGWILRHREEKSPHGLESKPKFTPKMEISDPKREDQEQPKLRIF